jgi:hypothetical protein
MDDDDNDDGDVLALEIYNTSAPDWIPFGILQILWLRNFMPLKRIF